MATTQSKSKSAGKKPAATKAQAKAQQPATQERVPGQGAVREVLGIGLLGLGLFIAYFVLFDSVAGIGKQIDALVRGLAGVVHYVIPGALVWAGILVIASSKHKLPSPYSVLLVCAFVLTICAGIHVFAYDDVALQMSQMPSASLRYASFVNFCRASYAHRGSGTGVLGALLCWPLYFQMNLKLAGTSIVLVVLLIIELVLMRKISLYAISERAKEGAQRIRETYRNHRDAHSAQSELEAPRPAKPTADAAFEELEDWDKGKQPEPQQDSTQATSATAPVREMHVPKFDQEQGTVKRRSARIEPIEAEAETDLEPLIPPHMKRNKRPKKRESQLSPIKEPTPILSRILQEERGESTPDSGATQSGAAQFDGVLDEVELPLPKPSWLDDPLPLEEDADDDEPPFDIPSSEPKREPARVDVRAMPVAKPVTKEFGNPFADTSAHEEVAYNYPPIDILPASRPAKIANQEQHDAEKAGVLLEALRSFGISARLIGIAHGPTVTRFELSPAAGVKVSRITSLADDIALNLAAVSVRIEAPIPGKAAVGVEVPNEQIETVPLRDVLESSEARRHPSRLAVGLGRDNAGRYIVADLAKMPHVLIAGATGAGKSVCINCIICSILYRATPDEVRLIMIDPKVVELSAYNGIPHLLVPVVTDPKKAASALEWAVVEMGTRYKKFAEIGAKDIKGYNQRRPKDEPPMPQIVIIIDELADLMMVAPGEVEDAICRLAQLARAAGIHLVIATQRPSVNVITGVIKANIPSRVAFTVASAIDSRTILDVGGAEKLLGRGDMLFAPSGTNKPQRVQGAWVSEDEAGAVVDYIKGLHDAAYNEDIIEHMASANLSDAEKEDANAEYDDLLPQAIEICVEAGQASISMLQRRLRVGYARAGRLIDEMAARGVVSQAEGAKPRSVLISREQLRMMFDE